MASIPSIRLPEQQRLPAAPVKCEPPCHVLLAVGGALGIGLLGGLGASLGVWAGGGHWASAIAGGLFGLGAGGPGFGAGLLLLLSADDEAPPHSSPPTDDLWLSDHERWDRLFDRLSRSPRLPSPPKVRRERPKSRPPLAR